MMKFEPHKLTYPMNNSLPVKGIDAGPQKRDFPKQGKDRPAPACTKFSPANDTKPRPA